MKIKNIIFLFFFSFKLLSTTVAAQLVPAPKQVLGFDVGDDYKLADYFQIIDYFKILAQSSDKIQLEKIGATTEGNDFFVSIISSKDNLRTLGYYKAIQKKHLWINLTLG